MTRGEVKKLRELAALGWHSLPQFLRIYEGGDRGMLGISVLRTPGSDRWFAVALETGNPKRALEDHAHRGLGDFATQEEATATAEAFAAIWLLQEVAPAPRCDCEEIGAAP